MRETRRISVAAGGAAAVLALLVAGCAARAPRGPVAPEVAALPADLVLMPIGDQRPPAPDTVDVVRDVRTTAIRRLAKKGYTAVARDEVAGGAVAAPRDLETTPAEELAALGPPGAGGLLFIAVRDVQRSYDYAGETFQVILSALIVEPAAERIVWRSTGSGRTSLEGMMRIFTPQSPAYDAVFNAVRSLFSTLPKRSD